MKRQLRYSTISYNFIQENNEINTLISSLCTCDPKTRVLITSA